LPGVGVVCDDWMLYGPKVDAWTAAHAGHPRRAAFAERRTGIPATLDLGTAATWLFLSETVRRRATGAGLELASTEICNRGADDELFQPVAPREWGWRLLYLGRLDERKGVDTAVEALAHVDHARLTIDGPGEPVYREHLERLARELGVGDRIEFADSPRADVPEAYAAADVVVFPVRWDEPWGLVPLEAMAVGRPVVATGRGGSGEYLADRRNCLLFEPSDAAGLAGAVTELAADYELRGQLVVAGFETAARFSERAFNEQVERALERA
jgi:glycosyltransferase involved in cell wall biosynthesis